MVYNLPSSTLDLIDSTAIVICNSKLIIKHTNLAFLNIIHEKEMPIDIPLFDFISMENNLELIDSTPYKVDLRIRPDLRLYGCTFILLNNKVYFFSKLIEHDDIETISQLSMLNNEIANISRELSHKNKELVQLNKKNTELVRTDPLTGLYNRRYFSEIFIKSLNLYKRHDIDLSLIMCDMYHLYF